MESRNKKASNKMKQITVITFLMLIMGDVLAQATNKLDLTGNVGIGITTPQYLLDVAGRFRAAAQFLSYTPDGLFNSNSQPSGITTPNGQFRIRFGYLDQGGGQYWGRIGFLANTNWSLGTATGGDNFSIGRNYAGADILIASSGYVGIGVGNPTEKLSVDGNIRSRKVIVTQAGWSDYVFNDDYKLMSLKEVEQFIKTNKHLPDIPSAKEVEEKGISVGDNQALLLKKIEELTLYLIAQQDEIRQLRGEFAKLKRLKKK
jgi:hypothetical protein